MSQNLYTRDRERLAAAAQEALIRRVGALQARLTSEILAHLAERLRADESGRLVFTVENVGVTRSVARLVKGFVQEQGRGLMAWMVRQLRRIFDVNAKYFGSFNTYDASIDERALRLLMLNLGYDVRTGKLTADGFFQRLFAADDVAASVARDVQRALAGRPSLAVFRRQMRQRFTHVGRGYLEAHFRRWTGDLFFQFDAAAQLTLAQELGLEYFQYAGTLIATSRCFCEKRLNRVYTVDFAEGWENIDWDGKIPVGTFFVNRGGYNCRHHLSFISKAQAERVMRGRGIALNSYNRAGCEEKRPKKELA